MLLPDNIHPEQTVYFNGAFVLQAVQELHSAEMLDLFVSTTQKRKMSMPVFVLCLDWLYLLGLIKLTKDGQVEACF